MFSNESSELGGFKFKKITKALKKRGKLVKKVLKKRGKLVKKVVKAPLKLTKKIIKKPLGMIAVGGGLGVPLAIRSIIRKKKKKKEARRAEIEAQQSADIQEQLQAQGIPADMAEQQAEIQARRIADQQVRREIPMTYREETMATRPLSPAELVPRQDVRQAAEETFRSQGMSPQQAEQQANAVAEGEAPVPSEVEEKIAVKAGMGPLMLVGILGLIGTAVMLGGKKKRKK